MATWLIRRLRVPATALCCASRGSRNDALKNPNTICLKMQAILIPIFRGPLWAGRFTPIGCTARNDYAVRHFIFSTRRREDGRLRHLPYTVSLPGKNSHTNPIAQADFTSQAVGWLACCLFILLSLLLIPHAGIQDDESLFALPLWLPMESRFEIRIFHHDVALMIASYLGTLKTCIYWPIFKLVGSGVFAVRVPMLLAGVASIHFFFKLLLRSGPPAAAYLGALLLATEPTFLLTNTFDWGPVALEHLLLIAGGYALLRFVQGGRNEPKFLAIGFFLFGLALWNKALFLWAL